MVNARRMKEEIVNEGVPPQGLEERQVPQALNDERAMKNVYIRSDPQTLTQVITAQAQAMTTQAQAMTALAIEMLGTI